MDCKKNSPDDIARELEAVGTLIGTCVTATEMEFVNVRSKAQDQSDPAWAEMQLLLQKSKRVIESLLRRQKSAVGLYTASLGILDDVVEERETSTTTPPTSVTKKLKPITKTTIEAARDDDVDRTPESPSPTLRNLTKLNDPREWEVQLVEKVKLKLSSKRQELIGQGANVDQIDKQLSFVQMSLENAKKGHFPIGRNQSNHSEESHQTPKQTQKSVRFNITPPPSAEIFKNDDFTSVDQGSASPPQNFDRMICKIAVGSTPRNRKPIVKEKRVDEIDDLLELIGASPAPNREKKVSNSFGLPRKLFA